MIIYVVIVVAVIIAMLVIRGIHMLKTQLPGYRDFWISQNELPIPQDALVYVALGDSAAQGIGATKPENSYVWLFAKQLEQTTGKQVSIINLSVSGAKIKDVYELQLPELAKLQVQPDVISVDIGGNNMRNYKPVQFKSEFETLLKTLPEGSLVADIPYFGPDFHGHGGKQAKQANKILDDIFPKYNQQRVDIYGATKGNDNLKYYGYDLFHPSDISYRLWANAFLEAYSRKPSD